MLSKYRQNVVVTGMVFRKNSALRCPVGVPALSSNPTSIAVTLYYKSVQ